MTWYYEQSGQRFGPVTDSDLDTLYKQGTVRGETLVWREGMADWASFSQAKGGPSVATATMDSPNACAECGNVFPPEDLIRFGDRNICAACKPIYVQKMREGAAIAGMMEYAGFWIRFGAKFVDNILLQIAGFFVGLAAGLALKDASPLVSMAVIYAVTTAVAASYTTFFIGKFGATPGKMAAKVRVVNADGSKVSYAKAFGRYFAEILSAIILLIGYIMAAFDDEKRALHDRICGTRVIKVQKQ